MTKKTKTSRRTLILALGNPILSDDAVGWLVGDRLLARLGPDNVDLLKEPGASIDIVGKLAPYGRLIIVDAIQLGEKPVGSVYKFSLDDLESTVRRSSAHDINFATAFQTGRDLGYQIPEDVRIYAIEAKELQRFSENCTPELAVKLDQIAGEIMEDLKSTERPTSAE